MRGRKGGIGADRTIEMAQSELLSVASINLDTHRDSEATITAEDTFTGKYCICICVMLGRLHCGLYKTVQ